MKAPSRNQVKTQEAQVTPHDTPHVEKLLAVLEGEMSRSDLMKKMVLKDRMHFGKNYLRPALVENLIEMTIPDKPKSRQQKYRLTAEGEDVLIKMKEEKSG